MQRNAAHTSMTSDHLTGLPVTLRKAVDPRSRCNDQTEE